jgi:hypothetical protein
MGPSNDFDRFPAIFVRGGPLSLFSGHARIERTTREVIRPAPLGEVAGRSSLAAVATLLNFHCSTPEGASSWTSLLGVRLLAVLATYDCASKRTRVIQIMISGSDVAESDQKASC